MLPLAILITVALTGWRAVLASREATASRPWPILFADLTVLGIVGPLLALPLFRDSPDRFVFVSTVCVVLLPVLVLGYSLQVASPPLTRATRAWCSKYGWLVGLTWGLAESTLFFVVPDVGVAFVAALSPRNWWKPALASIAGTLIGAVLLFLAIHLWLYANARLVLLLIPGIHPSTLSAAEARIAGSGAGALLPAAFSGIPYKVYATELCLAGISLPALLAWTVPSRLIRLLPVAAAAAGIGHLGWRVIDKYLPLVVALYALAWLVFYSWYWTR